LSMMSKVVTSIRKEKCSIGIKRGSSWAPSKIFQ
jgi:hypothetical protein